MVARVPPGSCCAVAGGVVVSLLISGTWGTAVVRDFFAARSASLTSSAGLRLADHMNSTLGSKLGQKHHAPDLSKDIRKLLDSLREKAVYEVKMGRTVDQANTEITNVVAAGLQALPGPLREYNERFEQLHNKYRQKPLIGEGK